MDLENKLTIAMEKAGVDIDGAIDFSSNVIQRFRVKNHYKRGKPLFVAIHNYGEGASFGDWREPATWQTVWGKSWSEISYAERQERKQLQFLERRKKELKHNHAVWRAQLLLAHATAASLDNPYVKIKKIFPYQGLQIRSYLILPMTDVNKRLISLQYIKPNTFKQFKKNTIVKGAMLFLNPETLPHHTVRICEGYATGCSIYECMGETVVIAFSSGNLARVAKALREKYPQNTIEILADNDFNHPENPGLNNALHAAEITRAKIIYPENLKDWNDVFCAYGFEEVENQILK